MAELHPRRTAGCHQRQIPVLRQPLQKLLRLLHDGQIRRQRHIVNLVKPHPVHRVHDHAHHTGAVLHAECVSHGDPDSRRDLRDNPDRWIADRFPDLIHVGVDCDRPGRTVDTALAAVHTAGLGNRAVERSRDQGVRPSSRKLQNAEPLQLRAGPHAVAAKNTLVHVPDDRRRTGVNRAHIPRVMIWHGGDIHLMRQILQPAVPTLRTGRAVPVMRAQKQLNNHLPVLLKTDRICINCHPVPRNLRAGRKHLPPLVLHHAESAGSEGRHLRQIAQSRDVDPRFADDGQHILLICEGNTPSIDCHDPHLSPLLSTRYRSRQTHSSPGSFRSGCRHP